MRRCTSNRRGRRRSLHAVAGAAVLSATLWAAAGIAHSKSGSLPPRRTFNIALIGSDSGVNGDLGTWDYQGVSLAAAYVNSHPRAHFNVHIKITRFDDQGDPTTAASLAQEAVSDHADLVYGSSLSTDTLAMMPVLSAAHIPQMTSGQSNAIVEEGDDYVFLDSAPSSVYDATLAKYALDRLGFTRVAMLSNNDAYGASEHAQMLANLTVRGLTPTDDEIVPPTATDLTGALAAIATANPKALFLGMEEVQSGLAVKQARALGITATILEGAPAATPIYLQTAGLANVVGTIVSTPYLSNTLNARTKQFAAAYVKAYGVEPELHGAKAYDGMMVIATALDMLRGRWTGPTLAAALHRVRYAGLTGQFVYDRRGLGLHATQIAVIGRTGTLVVPNNAAPGAHAGVRRERTRR
jgi:branched-chain amino acid transport system substrate-binding protein